MVGTLVTVDPERNWVLAYDRPRGEPGAWGMWRLRPGDLALVVSTCKGCSLVLWDSRLGWARTSWLVLA